jgi:serine protease Do
MMSRALLRSLLAALFSLSLAGASWGAPRPAPLPVKAAELHPLTFTRLVFRLENEDDIGLGKAEFRVHFLEELRRLGYPAVGAESLVFDRDNSNQARFLLGGTVTDLTCLGNVRAAAPRSCEISVAWEVMDADLDRLVYRVTTKAEVRRGDRDLATMGRELMMGALHSLLARPRFVESLRRRSEPAAGKRQPEVGFRACRAPALTMPRGASQVLRASVLVEMEGGHGSGLLISPDGLVLTAAHVVKSVRSAQVRLQDGTELGAVVVRLDADADVALLKLEKASLPTSCLALRHTPVATGEEVYAVGAPLDRSLAFSLTRGILSGTREVRGTTLLQTDATVNAGNSGGPLVDDSGRAIAVVRSKAVGTGVEGVAFGVPIMVAIARLGIRPDESTAPALLTPMAQAPDVAPAIDDVADDLHPVFHPAPLARGPAPASAVSARVQTPAGESTSWTRWRWAGWVTLAVGTVAVVGSTAGYGARNDRLTQREFNTLRTINDIGWVAAASGAIVVVSSYVFEAPAGTRRSASLGVGPGAITFAGSF